MRILACFSDKNAPLRENNASTTRFPVRKKKTRRAPARKSKGSCARFERQQRGWRKPELRKIKSRSVSQKRPLIKHDDRNANAREVAKWKAQTPKEPEFIEYQRSFTPEPLDLSSSECSDSCPEDSKAASVSSMSVTSFSNENSPLLMAKMPLDDQGVCPFNGDPPVLILNPSAKTFRPRPRRDSCGSTEGLATKYAQEYEEREKGLKAYRETGVWPEADDAASWSPICPALAENALY